MKRTILAAVVVPVALTILFMAALALMSRFDLATESSTALVVFVDLSLFVFAFFLIWSLLFTILTLRFKDTSETAVRRDYGKIPSRVP